VGLDLAELAMEVEEEFCITISEDPPRRIITVQDLLDEVWNSYDWKRITEAINEIPPNGPNGYIEQPDYECFRSKYSWLPYHKSWLKYKKYTHSSIHAHLSSKYYSSKEEVQRALIVLVKNKAGTKAEIPLHSRFVEDLGLC